MLVVVYPDIHSLAEDYRSSLKNLGLAVPRLAEWRVYDQVHVELVLPGGRVEAVDGVVVSDLGPAGMALQLELSPRQKARIRQLVEEAG